MVAKTMIVYSGSKKRLDNYENIKKYYIPDLNIFSARDSINSYDHYVKYGFDNNYHTREYVKEYELYPGKIGCNISHIELIKGFSQSNDDWLLVLEDDISIKNYSDSFINNLISVANNNNSDYVHLYTNPKYYDEQKRQSQIAPNIYPMIYQWGGVAYLINKKGATKLLSFLPYSKNFDIILSLHIADLNSICCLNDIFNTEGALNSIDRASKFGSLIWNI